MILRSYQPEDLQACLDIEKVCFDGEQTSFSGFADMSVSSVLVVEVNSVICGYVVFSVVADESEIFQIALSPEFRGQGMAKKLMEEVLKELELKSVVQLFLEVRESNTSARGLYESLGMEAYDRRKAYYVSIDGSPKEDAILYRLILS